MADIVKAVKTEPYRIYEQDVFNILIQNDVHFVDEKWNLFTLGGNYKDQLNFSPANMYFTYMNAREKPAIVHFAGSDKPWNNPYTDLSLEFWKIAKETTVYDIIMGRMIDARSNWFISMQPKQAPITEKIDNKEELQAIVRIYKRLRRTLLWRGLRKIYKIIRK